MIEINTWDESVSARVQLNGSTLTLPIHRRGDVAVIHVPESHMRYTAGLQASLLVALRHKDPSFENLKDIHLMEEGP